MLDKISDYISGFSGDARDKLNELRRLLGESVNGGVEAVGYQMPAVKFNGRFLLYYAGWKEHVSMYPIPKGDEKYRKLIKPYAKSKGTLQFKLGEELPVAVIKETITSLLLN
jgi:uncharacterized protein YdhG (YjbR/CyaY superfamily)